MLLTQVENAFNNINLAHRISQPSVLDCPFKTSFGAGPLSLIDFLIQVAS